MTDKIRPIPPGSSLLRELCHAVDQALALPAPATKRDELVYLRIVRDRARLVRDAARRILRDRNASDRDVMTAALEMVSDIAAEFPAWEITLTPSGMWAGYWQSVDGRQRRFIIAPAASMLLQRLRHAGLTDRTVSADHPV